MFDGFIVKQCEIGPIPLAVPTCERVPDRSISCPRLHTPHTSCSRSSRRTKALISASVVCRALGDQTSSPTMARREVLVSRLSHLGSWDVIVFFSEIKSQIIKRGSTDVIVSTVSTETSKNGYGIIQVNVPHPDHHRTRCYGPPELPRGSLWRS